MTFPTVFALSDVYTVLGWILIAYFVKYVYQKVYLAFVGPLRKVPGPKLAALSSLPNQSRQAFGVRWKWIQRDLYPKYGKVVRSAPAGVIFADRDVVKRIIQQEDLPKDPTYSMLRREPIYETLFSATTRDFHKKRRRMLSPAFSMTYLSSLEPLMTECVQDLVDKVNATIGASESATVNLCDIMAKLTLDVIGNTAFGGSFNLVKTGDHPLPNKVGRELRYRLLTGLFPFLTPFLRHDDYLDKFTANIIKQRRQKKVPPRKDILQIMLDAQEGNVGLTDDEINDQLVEFIIAGNDTTAFSLVMCIVQLLKHPIEMQALIKELDEAFPSTANSRAELPNADVLKKLPWLNACIKEGMRLWPITLEVGTGRFADNDIILDGYLIPKGTEVQPNFYALHHSAEYWGPDVEEYKPERFLDPDKIPRDCYYPFSGGSRSCIGMNFAISEMRLVIASLLLRFRLQDVPGQDYTDLVAFITPSLRSKRYDISFTRRT